MQLHQLKPSHKSRKRKRVGRGGKHGTYSGKGQKGQKSRAGARFKPAIREWLKRYPKLRGYKFKSFRKKPVIVNVGILAEKFNSGEVVSPKTLLERKIISRIKGKTPKVKILGDGELTKSLMIEGCEVSENAKEEIEKAGGRVK